jgi:hypothetical protein
MMLKKGFGRESLKTSAVVSNVVIACACSVLCVCVLENHVFLGTRIDQKIAARSVFVSAYLTGAPLPGKISQKVSS